MSRDYDKLLELIRKQLAETRRQSAELRDIAKAARIAAEHTRKRAQATLKLAALVRAEAAKQVPEGTALSQQQIDPPLKPGSVRRKPVKRST
jgi:hypothetical protein